jgi:hypothetical protein
MFLQGHSSPSTYDVESRYPITFNRFADTSIQLIVTYWTKYFDAQYFDIQPPETDVESRHLDLLWFDLLVFLPSYHVGENH